MLTIALILAFIPVLNFYLQYTFSKKDNKLNVFKSHWTAYYGDFAFIPVFMFFIYSFTGFEISHILISLFFALTFNIAEHLIFIKMGSTPGENWVWVNQSEKKLTSAGWVHFLFSTFATFIIVLAAFLIPVLPFYYLFYIFMLLISFILPFGGYKIHSKFQFPEFIIGLAIFIVFTLKLFYL
jgi:hypothetical protein